MATQDTPLKSAPPQPFTPLTNGVKKARKVYKPRYIDIGINLTDPVFTGLYHSTQRHPNDLSDILQRAKETGCKKLIVTGSDLEESWKAVELAKEHPGVIYATIGVHPCNCSQFIKTPSSASTILAELKTLAIQAKTSNHAVAFGEIGLDYDRLEHCSKEIQLQYFEAQLSLATEIQLPLFLHSRAAHSDFLSLLSKYEDRLPRKGVVHSFTGTKEEMWELVRKGWDIGINGCSMKTSENCQVVKEVPLDRLQVETDGPWCEIRGSHASAEFLKGRGVGLLAVREEKGNGKVKKGKKSSEITVEVKTTEPVPQTTGAASQDEQSQGTRLEIEEEQEEDVNGELQEWKSVKKERWSEGMMIKGRNEPCMIGHVAWAIAAIKGISVKEVSEAAWENSVRMFGVSGD